jgi:DNA-binding response OmpR family regulator
MQNARMHNGRILVLEDDYLLALLYADWLRREGAVVVGPSGTLTAALPLARGEAIDAAVLDINLGKDLSFPVADVLAARSVPFIFVSGWGALLENSDHALRRCLAKPTSSEAFMGALREEMASSWRPSA